ncbi:MAG: hypothetical protein WCO02_08795 [Bacteroidota bacterium]
MKNLILFSIFCFMGINLAYAQFPIPSYNAVVDDRATFIEQSTNLKSVVNTDTQRKIQIKRHHSTKTPGDDVTFYVCSLDGQTTLGPYNIAPGQTISIDIDDREWGIVVFAAVEVVLDVWITEGNSPGGNDQ